ncbi:MAG: hypothetical protein WC654_04850 [Patescibacteria group bacterium]
MGKYANVTSRRMIQLLKWLGNHKDVDVVTGGRHPTKVTSRRSQETYPLPIGHTMVNKYIIQDFVKWLVRNDICTEQEFDENI